MFDDGLKTNEKGEIVIEDKDFEGIEEIVSNPIQNSDDTTKVANDGSQISIMYDSAGNKTETRYFNNSRIKYLLLRTSVNGQKELFVFGHNGQTKTLPENMLDKVLTASADEIANAAGIYTTRQERSPVFTQDQKPSESIKPLPSSEFIAQNRPAESLSATESEPETVGQTPKTEKREAVSTARNPEDEQ
ncbi:MAG TPA: hypothetical protein VK892_19420 [Pyrinomonadaceae bacterium]|nr:hypothetical protein [Pyrinomonadaceae bacterium]